MNAPKVMMQQQPDRKVHIPNLLTMARVVLAWVFVGLLSGVEPRTLNAELIELERSPTPPPG